MEKKKLGRPTTNPRNKSLQLRLSETELEILNKCSEITGKPRTEIIVSGVKKIYEEITR